jgi:hypothetical protein
MMIYEGAVCVCACVCMRISKHRFPMANFFALTRSPYLTICKRELFPNILMCGPLCVFLWRGVQAKTFSLTFISSRTGSPAKKHECGGGEKACYSTESSDGAALSLTEAAKKHVTSAQLFVDNSYRQCRGGGGVFLCMLYKKILISKPERTKCIKMTKCKGYLGLLPSNLFLECHRRAHSFDDSWFFEAPSAVHCAGMKRKGKVRGKTIEKSGTCQQKCATC